MNVIVANKRQSELSNLDVDIIKSISGSYTSKEIIDMFNGFFYNKMILDVTALKQYNQISTYEELISGLAPDKIILLLPEGSKLCTPNFLGHIISLGIYNFTTDIKGIKFLIREPNTLEKVEHIRAMASNYNNMKSSDNNESFNDTSNDVSNNSISNNNEDFNSNNNIDNSYNDNSNYVNNNNSNDFSNNNNDDDFNPIDVVSNDNGNNYNNTSNSNVIKINGGTTIIGFRNVTEHAGASTLIYMLKKELSLIYGSENVVAIEIDNSDFQLFNDKFMVSTSSYDFSNTLSNYSNASIILVDLNNFQDDSYCSDIIYLIEPSTIMLNKLIRRDRKIFTELNNKKIILNKSLLSVNDMNDFEEEAGINVFYNIPTLDDRKSNGVLNDFLNKLGLIGGNNSKGDNANKIFGLFRR